MTPIVSVFPVVLLAMVGSFIGWQPVLIVFFLAPVCALLVALAALILHGRRVCRPTPDCDRCPVRDDCTYTRALEREHRSPTGGRRGPRTIRATRGRRAR